MRITNTVKCVYTQTVQQQCSGGANVFAARGKRLCCRPHPEIRSPIDILMVTTITLVWTVSSALSWGCNCVIQWNLGWSVATAKKKTAAHTCQKRPHFRIPYFAPQNAAHALCSRPSVGPSGRWDYTVVMALESATSKKMLPISDTTSGPWEIPVSKTQIPPSRKIPKKIPFRKILH